MSDIDKKEALDPIGNSKDAKDAKALSPDNDQLAAPSYEPPPGPPPFEANNSSDKKDLHQEQPAASSFEPPSGPPPSKANDSSDKKDLRPELVSGEVFIPPGGEEPPPEFAPYEAEFVVKSDGHVISHDKHLNEDGEALFRFLLAKAQEPPKYLASVRGTHTEVRWRTVYDTGEGGRQIPREESYTETIIDFDFKLDISQYIVAGPLHWSTPDSQPAFRGKMHKEVDEYVTVGGNVGAGGDGKGKEVAADPEAALPKNVRKRRKAKDDEVNNARARKERRVQRGLPPWYSEGGIKDMLITSGGGAAAAPQVDAWTSNNLRSSMTLREWADEYCACKKRLKEFTYKKEIYGWNISALTSAITSAVRSTGYAGNTSVTFNMTSDKIHIRPDNGFSRMLSKTWVVFLLCITLVYPFILIYKRVRGGAKWEVCGGAYALKSWQPVDPSIEPPPGAFEAAAATGRVITTESGVARLVGLREGEWFQQWEGTIKRVVYSRVTHGQILAIPDHAVVPAAMLDGYRGP